MPEIATSHIELGRFEVKTGTLKVSDPCYAEGTWCAGDVENARNGWWSAGALVGKVGGWGERVLALGAAAPHVDCDRLIEMALMGALEDTGIDVGVDSGQCGIFDKAVYRSENDQKALQEIVSWARNSHHGELVDRMAEDGDLFYAACCALTLNKPCAGVMPGGCIASSGIGDGSYKCFVRKDGDAVIGAVIVFIDPKSEE